MKENLSSEIQRILSLLFWTTHCICILVGGICFIAIGVTSMGAGPMMHGTGDLLCPLVLE